MFDYSGEPEEPNFLEGSGEVEYVKGLRILNRADHLVKTRYSAFKNSELLSILRKHSINTIIICGFMANFCCAATAMDAHDMDYFVEVPLGAIGCPDMGEIKQEEIKRILSGTLGAGFARVVKTKDLI